MAPLELIHGELPRGTASAMLLAVYCFYALCTAGARGSAARCKVW
jgi:hypothetical protein